MIIKYIGKKYVDLYNFEFEILIFGDFQGYLKDIILKFMRELIDLYSFDEIILVNIYFFL